jgi:hypothetical protein
MLGLSIILVVLAMKPLLFKGKDWREEVGLEER